MSIFDNWTEREIKALKRGIALLWAKQKPAGKNSPAGTNVIKIKRQSIVGKKQYAPIGVGEADIEIERENWAWKNKQ